MGAPRISRRKRDELLFAYLAVPSIAYVSRVCGVTEKTARRYRREDSWERKEILFAETLLEAGLESLESVRNELDAIARALVKRFKREVSDGDIRITNVGDLIRLGEFRLMMRGQATDIHGLKVLPSGKHMDDATAEELTEAADALMQEALHFQKGIKRAAERQKNGSAGGNGEAVIEAEVVPISDTSGKKI